VWNKGGSDFSESLSSAGMGLLWDISRHAELNLYWAEGFDDISGGDDLQDNGLQLQAQVSF